MLAVSGDVNNRCCCFLLLFSFFFSFFSFSLCVCVFKCVFCVCWGVRSVSDYEMDSSFLIFTREIVECEQQQPNLFSLIS